jgi:hypothetical protein
MDRTMWRPLSVSRQRMSIKWSKFAARFLTIICFFGEAIYAQRLRDFMFDVTAAHYHDPDGVIFELFPIQDGLDILFRGLLTLSILWLLLALNTIIDWRKYIRRQ